MSQGYTYERKTFDNRDSKRKKWPNSKLANLDFTENGPQQWKDKVSTSRKKPFSTSNASKYLESMQNHRKFAFGPSSLKNNGGEISQQQLLGQAYKLPNRDRGS